MSPAIRKFLPSLILAVAGGAALYAWSANHQLPATAGAGSSAPASTLPKASRPPSPGRLAFISDPGEPWQIRIDGLRRTLAGGCGEPEIRYLYHLLKTGAPTGELPEHWYVIANDIMSGLFEHDTDPERYAGTLIRLLNSPQQPMVVRDYAVQHLASWLGTASAEAGGSGLPVPAPEVSARILQAMAAAATDRSLEQSSIPGTTLMMLVNLSRAPGGVDCSQTIASLKPWLSEALGEGSTLDNSIRVSAVQAAGTLLPQQFRPVIRRIAYSEGGQSSLRLPAIAALGQCGDAEDVARLRAISQSHPELSYAAQDACTTLLARLGQSAPAVSDN